MEETKCLVELDEILEHLSYEDLKKIPYEIRKAIKDKKDKQYIWHYDNSKSLSSQNINRRTIVMLSYINMEYLLSEEERALMEEIHKFNEIEMERDKKDKCIDKYMFKRNYVEKPQEEVMLMEIQRNKWYKKIVHFIRRILKRG